MTPKQKRNKKKKLISEYGSCCWWCGRRLPSDKLTLDHLKPTSIGGSNSLENLRLVCFPCNNSRGDSLFARPLGEKLLDSVPKDMVVAPSAIDSKSQFQELVQADGVTAPPQYLTVRTGGTDHEPEFTSRVYVNNKLEGFDKGRSKKEAEKKAADDALAKFKK